MTGLEVQIWHVVGGILISILGVGISIWRVVQPAFKAIRENDKRMAGQDHEIELLKSELSHTRDEMKGRFESAKNMTGKNHDELKLLISKMSANIDKLLESRSFSKAKLEELEKRLEKLEESK